jgi:CheY-like chemotaxis protein
VGPVTQLAESTVNDAPNPKMNNPKIFVVEDDVDIARLVRHSLESAGYRIRAFSTTHGVLLDAQKERPSLFLLDIMVPGGDGLDLCRQIRQAGALLSMTPIIFLTAKTSEVDRILGLEMGADDYITKPFSPRELVARGSVAPLRASANARCDHCGRVADQYGSHDVERARKSGGYHSYRVPAASLSGAASGQSFYARPVARCRMARYYFRQPAFGGRLRKKATRKN